mmetsp:Transcript_27756/g.86019  ORF Transcript_27756/g.86019 Transcript_27756/m.86019 type:complete len:779 (-) Transcript_27756:54-2390(-)
MGCIAGAACDEQTTPRCSVRETRRQFTRRRSRKTLSQLAHREDLEVDDLACVLGLRHVQREQRRLRDDLAGGADLLDVLGGAQGVGVLLALGLGDEEDAALVDAAHDVRGHGLGVVRRVLVHDVEREHEVEAVEVRVQVGGVRLVEHDVLAAVRPRAALGEDGVRLALAGGGVDDGGIGGHAALPHREGGLEHAGGEVDADDLAERERELVRRAAGAGEQVHGALGLAALGVRLEGGDGEVSEHLRVHLLRRHVDARRQLRVRALRGEVNGRVEAQDVLHVLRLVDGGALDEADADVLEEMPAERETRVARRLVAGGHPRAALHAAVPAVEGRHGEVVVQRVHLVAGVRVHGGLAVLPHVADDVVKLALLELLDGAAAAVVLKVDVARGDLPLVLVALVGDAHVAHVEPLGLGGQAEGLALLGAEPLGVGGGLKVVHLARPRPLHVDLGALLAQLEAAVVSLGPEPRVLGLLPRHPVPALLVPQLLLRVATVLDELEELGVGHNVLLGLEGGDVDGEAGRVVAVPAVDGGVEVAADLDLAAGELDEGVLGRDLALLRARVPERNVPDVLHRELAHVDGGGLEVDALVLAAHEHGPEEGVRVVVGGVLEGERQRHRVLGEEVVDALAQGAAVLPHVSDGGPVVVRLVQVIPRHLVDADGERLLELVVDAGGEAGEGDLVQVERRGVAEVENERVAQLVHRGHGEGLVAVERLEALLEDLVRGVEVLAQLLLLQLGLRGGVGRVLERDGDRLGALEVAVGGQAEALRRFLVSEGLVNGHG